MRFRVHKIVSLDVARQVPGTNRWRRSCRRLVEDECNVIWVLEATRLDTDRRHQNMPLVFVQDFNYGIATLTQRRQVSANVVGSRFKHATWKLDRLTDREPHLVCRPILRHSAW